MDAVEADKWEWNGSSQVGSLGYKLSHLEESLCCTICGDFFKNPHILNCGHSFCKLCILTHLDKNFNKTSTVNKCPSLSCNAACESSQLKPNRNLSTIVSNFQSSRSILINIVNNPSSTAALIITNETRPTITKSSSSSSSSSIPIRKLPQKVFHKYPKDKMKKELSSLCASCGSSVDIVTDGSVDELIKRYHELVLLNNAQINSDHPLSFTECVLEINKRERILKLESKQSLFIGNYNNYNTSNNSKYDSKNLNNNNHDEQFKKLIQSVRKSKNSQKQQQTLVTNNDPNIEVTNESEPEYNFIVTKIDMSSSSHNNNNSSSSSSSNSNSSNNDIKSMDIVKDTQVADEPSRSSTATATADMATTKAMAEDVAVTNTDLSHWQVTWSEKTQRPFFYNTATFVGQFAVPVEFADWDVSDWVDSLLSVEAASAQYALQQKQSQLSASANGTTTAIDTATVTGAAGGGGEGSLKSNRKKRVRGASSSSSSSFTSPLQPSPYNNNSSSSSSGTSSQRQNQCMSMTYPPAAGAEEEEEEEEEEAVVDDALNDSALSLASGWNDNNDACLLNMTDMTDVTLMVAAAGTLSSQRSTLSTAIGTARTRNTVNSSSRRSRAVSKKTAVAGCDINEEGSSNDDDVIHIEHDVYSQQSSVSQCSVTESVSVPPPESAVAVAVAAVTGVKRRGRPPRQPTATTQPTAASESSLSTSGSQGETQMNMMSISAAAAAAAVEGGRGDNEGSDNETMNNASQQYNTLVDTTVTTAIGTPIDIDSDNDNAAAADDDEDDLPVYIESPSSASSTHSANGHSASHTAVDTHTHTHTVDLSTSTSASTNTHQETSTAAAEMQRKPNKRKRRDIWQCDKCTYLNKGDNDLQCEVCDNPRPTTTTSSISSSITAVGQVNSASASMGVGASAGTVVDGKMTTPLSFARGGISSRAVAAAAGGSSYKGYNSTAGSSTRRSDAFAVLKSNSSKRR